MTPEQLKSIIEAALMTADEPLNTTRLLAIFADAEVKPDKKAIKQALEQLQQDYHERSVELLDLASGYCFRVKKDYAKWVTKLWEMKPPRYSRALLETLALIVYKQPITRAEIEDVRGVAVSSYIIKTLLEREWIKIVGHKDVPGRPSLLATTKVFLDHFNLKNLADLPPLADIQDLDKIGQQLQMDMSPKMELTEGEESEELDETEIVEELEELEELDKFVEADESEARP